jgi:hypothetical protein
MRPIPRERTGQPAGTRLSFVAENPSTVTADGRTLLVDLAPFELSASRGEYASKPSPALAPAGRRATALTFCL